MVHYLTGLLIRSLTHSLTHTSSSQSLIYPSYIFHLLMHDPWRSHSYIHLLMTSLTPVDFLTPLTIPTFILTHFTHSLAHSLTHSPPHSLFDPFTDTLTFTHSLTDPFTNSSSLTPLPTHWHYQLNYSLPYPSLTRHSCPSLRPNSPPTLGIAQSINPAWHETNFNPIRSASPPPSPSAALRPTPASAFLPSSAEVC